MNLLPYLSRNLELYKSPKNSKHNDDSLGVILKQSDLKKWDGNAKWKIGSSYIVIDVDVRDKGISSFTQLRKDYPLDDKFYEFTVVTPTGGWHLYYRLPASGAFKVRRGVPTYPGIEFLSGNDRVLTAGSSINYSEYSWSTFDKNNNPVFHDRVLPKELADLILRKEQPYDFYKSSNESISGDQIKNLMKSLDCDCHYNTWVRIGMALHHWNVDEGLAIWRDWSSHGEKFAEGECEKKWVSFTDNYDKDNPVTIGSLVYLCQQNDDLTEAKDEIEREIDIGDSNYLLGDLIKKVKSIPFDDIVLDGISRKICNRLCRLGNGNVKPNAIRDKIQSQDSITSANMWADWVYVGNKSLYYRKSDGDMYNANAFNMIMSRHVPRKYRVRKASSYVMGEGLIRVARDTLFEPSSEKKLIIRNGHLYINSYDYRKVEAAAGEYTDEGRNLISKILRHYDTILGTEQSNILFSWISWILQYPTKRVGWVLLIYSKSRGVGKGLLDYIMTSMLGAEYCRKVTNSELRRGFTGWAKDKCFVTFDEIHIEGKNANDTINSLKSYFTEKEVTIDPKHVDPYTTKNTINYLALTNYFHSIPIASEDRRWFPIRTIPANKNQLSEMLATTDIDTYFSDFWNDIEKYSSQIKKFFLERPISKSFNHNSPPSSEFKNLMIDAEKSNTVGYDEFEDFLEIPSKYHDRKVVMSCAGFWNAFISFCVSKYPELNMAYYLRNNSKKRNLLCASGYETLGVCKKFNQTCRIYTTCHRTMREAKNYHTEFIESKHAKGRKNEYEL